MAIQLHVVSSLTRQPYEQLLNDLAHAQERLPDQISKLRREIATYERMHGMSSSEMREQLASGRLSETQDICMWLMKLELLGDVTPAT